MVNGTELLPTKVTDMVEQMQQLTAAGEQGDTDHTDNILKLVSSVLDLPWKYQHHVMSPWYIHMGRCTPCRIACIDAGFCET